MKRMYGVDLTTRVKVEDTAIPNLLTQCIEHIEKSGEWILNNFCTVIFLYGDYCACPIMLLTVLLVFMDLYLV